MTTIIPQTCKICKNSIHSAVHKQKKHRCSRLLQQQYQQKQAKAETATTPEQYPYKAKRHANGTYSTTEFY